MCPQKPIIPRRAAAPGSGTASAHPDRGRPKELDDIRGISYIYPLLYRWGVIQVPEMAAEKMDGTCTF